MIYVPAQRAAVYADRRRCTWMYETRNETTQIGAPAGRDAWPHGCQSQFWAAAGSCALVIAWTRTGRPHVGSTVSCSRHMPSLAMMRSDASLPTCEC
jgi:hypothetical protein